ncbi:hypothetical protein CL614_05255 [archaeon]|nr:hypothetical protein [archaeon]
MPNDGTDVGTVVGVQHGSKVKCPVKVEYTTAGKVLLHVLHNDREKTLVEIELTKGVSQSLRTLLAKAESHI